MTLLKTTAISALLCFASVPAFGNCAPSDEFLGTNTYDVLRKGKSMGKHTISFYGSPSALKIKAYTKMKVEVLFVTAFKYTYDSVETYCDNQLQSVLTRVNDNGKETELKVTRDQKDYVSETRDGDLLLPGPIFTSNHWTKNVTAATGILNTAKGNIDAVTVSGPLPSEIEGGELYQVRGDIDYDTHYDAVGNWLGMRFEHPKGGEIKFVCVDCKNTPFLDSIPFDQTVDTEPTSLVSMPSGQ